MKRIHEHKYELEGEQQHLLLFDREVYPDAQSRGAGGVLHKHHSMMTTFSFWSGTLSQLPVIKCLSSNTKCCVLKQ